MFGDVPSVLDGVHSYGSEIDNAITPVDHLNVTAGYNFDPAAIDDPDLEVAVCARVCMVSDLINAITGNARVDEDTLPQATRHGAAMTNEAQPGLHDAGEVFFLKSVTHRCGINFFLYRSTEFRSERLAGAGSRAGYVSHDGYYEIAASGRNICEGRGINFNNLAGFVNEPATLGMETSTRF